MEWVEKKISLTVCFSERAACSLCNVTRHLQKSKPRLQEGSSGSPWIIQSHWITQISWQNSEIMTRALCWIRKKTHPSWMLRTNHWIGKVCNTHQHTALATVMLLWRELQVPTHLCDYKVHFATFKQHYRESFPEQLMKNLSSLCSNRKKKKTTSHSLQFPYLNSNQLLTDKHGKETDKKTNLCKSQWRML